MIDLNLKLYDQPNERLQNKRFILKIFLHNKRAMEQKESHMVDMLKTAIKQEREFTKGELKKFDDLFEKIIDVKVSE